MISKILFNNFRNFDEKIFEFSNQVTAILGQNGAGKTNILEGVNMLSTGKSFKAKVESEMINYDSEIARIKGKIENGENQILEIVLTNGETKINGKLPKKRLLVNNTPKRLIDFSAKFTTTLFLPRDLDLVSGSPSLRRDFLDKVLSQTDFEYKRSLGSYEKGLRRRNKVLLSIREDGKSKHELYFWDNLLIKNGDYILKKREELIEFVNNEPEITKNKIEIKYDKSVISKERLKHYENAEIASATTLVGPHRDDFIFDMEIKNKMRDLSRFGSRGEQRMAVLALKIAETKYVKFVKNESSVLLLDDILSELDEVHREIVFDISRNQQTIITTADLHYLNSLKKVEIINL